MLVTIRRNRKKTKRPSGRRERNAACAALSKEAIALAALVASFRTTNKYVQHCLLDYCHAIARYSALKSRYRFESFCEVVLAFCSCHITSFHDFLNIFSDEVCLGCALSLLIKFRLPIGKKILYY